MDHLGNNTTPIEFLADYELEYTQEELDKLETQLSEQEEKELAELVELQQKAQLEGNHSFLKDMLEAAKEGAMNYLNSFTDTMDTFDHLKNPEDVNKWDNTIIEPIDTSADKEKASVDYSRTMNDAHKSSVKWSSEHITDGMSDSGKRLFNNYEKAYNQRTKSLSQLSKDGNQINRSDTITNFETLSGLRGYRLGPVIPMPSAQQAKDGYNQYLKDNGGTGKTPSSWLYENNMKQFDSELAKRLGFKTASEAKAWRKENKLTVHEGPDGMFMVPSDVHSAARHDGYRSMMTKYLKGELTKDDLNKYVRQEKIAFVKHEAKVRSARAVKGIGLSLVRDVMKTSIAIIIEETYNEFKEKKDGRLLERVKRLFKAIWEHIKEKCKKYFESIKTAMKNVWNTVKGSLLSEFFTLLNDFVFKTFKNIFKVMRTMWRSVVKAFKIIFSGEASWTERIIEASKVLSAGLVGVIGFSLNELIEKGLTSIGIPFSSFIAECLSGLFSGIMSAIVLMVFDSLKRKFISKSTYTQQSLIQAKLINIDCARLDISVLRTDMQMRDTFVFMGNTIAVIKETRDNIIIRENNVKDLLLEQKEIENKMKEQNRKLASLCAKFDDEDF